MKSYLWIAVNRKKLFEVMRGYGVHENLVGQIEIIYEYDNRTVPE